MSFRRPERPIIIKKYGNRRLYDTRASRYITLQELAELVRAGDDVRVVDAKTGHDLTQATLVQIILDGRGGAQLLPVGLLLQLVRMGDDALAEFLGRYMSQALELYLEARQGAKAMTPFHPFMSFPFAAANSMARAFQPERDEAPSGFEGLRAELDELRSALSELRGGAKPRRKAAPKRRS